ncbi:MAG: ATP-binding cassette domain-containing protein, partial [Proteobacteria bacterium]|nr:ATP-binding cassette domain-containing protein [Pseudomonadota bacterium]
MVVLELKSLEMSYKTQEGTVRAIDRASLRVEKGDTVGIVGESGCGKTSIGLSILRLLPPNATIHGGQILFKGQDLLSLSEKDMRRIR